MNLQKTSAVFRLVLSNIIVASLLTACVPHLLTTDTALLAGDALGIQTNADRADPGNQSIVTAASMLVTGLIAGATGENVQGAAAAAQNEALNNYLSKKQEADKAAADQNCGSNCDQVDAAFKSLSDANNAALASCLAKGSCRRTG